MKHVETLMLSICIIVGIGAPAFAADTLPPEVQAWFEQAVKLITTKLQEQYKGQEKIKRKDVAADTQIQKLLLEQAELLVTTRGFSCELKPAVKKLRVARQPKDYHGESPAKTEALMKDAAAHTIAGVAELVCEGGKAWRESLQDHFDRVGNS